MNNALSYGDKKILTVYKQFYDEEYDGVKDRDNWITHLKAQKMVYLLSSVGIYFGDIGFSWHTNGPFSNELQYNLKSLDQNRERVLKFYQNEGALVLQGAQLDFIKKIKSITVDKRPKNCAIDTWIELLASIFFIKELVLPFGTKDAVNAEVRKRNETLMTDTPVENAWSSLSEFEKQSHYI